MDAKTHLTVTEVARELGDTTTAVRRAADQAGVATRIGSWRVIPRQELPRLVQELRRRSSVPHGSKHPKRVPGPAKSQKKGLPPMGGAMAMAQ